MCPLYTTDKCYGKVLLNRQVDSWYALGLPIKKHHESFFFFFVFCPGDKMFTYIYWFTSSKKFNLNWPRKLNKSQGPCLSGLGYKNLLII